MMRIMVADAGLNMTMYCQGLMCLVIAVAAEAPHEVPDSDRSGLVCFISGKNIKNRFH